MTNYNSNSTPKIIDGENLRDILKNTCWLEIHSVDPNGRAKWTVYSEWHPGFRLAEGQINLINNYAHIDQVEGVRRHFLVDDASVDIDYEVVYLVENRNNEDGNGFAMSKIDKPSKQELLDNKTLDGTAYPEDLELSIWRGLLDIPIDTMFSKVFTLGEGLRSTKEIIKIEKNLFEINCTVDGWRTATADMSDTAAYLLGENPELNWE